MDPTPTNYEFSEEITVKNNDQPRLSRPERFDHNERTDLPQTETYIREERTTIEPPPRDTEWQKEQQQQQPQQFSEAYISEASAPQWNENSFEEVRRTSPTSSTDSLLQSTEPPTLDSPLNEKQIFGKHYWEQQQECTTGPNCVKEVPRRPVGRYIRDLIMWRNSKDSGVIFAAGLFLLFSLSYFSIISVFAYSSLAILLLTSSFVFLRQFMQTLQQKQGVHPFQPILNRDVVLSQEYAHQQLDNILVPVNRFLVNLRDLYLADSLAQTLKLAFFMYILTYLGAWFNLMTLATLVWVMAFTIPKFYVAYRSEIDSFLGMIKEQLREVQVRISEMFKQQRDKMVGRRRVNSRAGQQQQGENKTTYTRYEVKAEKVN